MAEIREGDIAAKLIAAVQTLLSPEDWAKQRSFYEACMLRTATALTTIGLMRELGEITDGEAKAHLDIEQNFAQTLLAHAIGLSKAHVENFMNEVLAEIWDWLFEKFPWL